jgi:hypothetical protein
MSLGTPVKILTHNMQFELLAKVTIFRPMSRRPGKWPPADMDPV